jgi:hypothetical protein
MKRWVVTFFCVTMGFFLSITALSGANKSAPTISEEMRWEDVGKIDQRIDELKQMKRGYESKAVYHDNQSQRLQFDHGQLSLAQKHMKLADANRDVAKKIQEEIDLLEARKQTLLKKQTTPPS